MCKEFPETSQRLIDWAIWRRDSNNLKQLGYPTSSSHTKPFGGGGGGSEIQDNPDAEQVDQIIAELSIKYSDIHAVLLSKYFYKDNDREGSKHCCMGKQKYQVYLKIGISWVDSRLFL